MYGRQSYEVSVGLLPNLVYMSASPVPPEIWKVSVVWPAGTAIDQNCWLPVAPEMPVCATPLTSTPSPGGGGGGGVVPPQVVGAVPTEIAANAQPTASLVAWS